MFMRRVLTYLASLQPVDDLAPIDQDLEKEHQEKTKVKNIQACMGLRHLRFH